MFRGSVILGTSMAYIGFIAIVTGVCGGGLLGGFLITHTETVVRAFQSPPGTYEINGLIGTIKLIGRGVVSILAIGVMEIGILVYMPRLAGVDGFPNGVLGLLSLGVLVGAAAGKYIQYLYWKLKA